MDDDPPAPPDLDLIAVVPPVPGPLALVVGEEGAVEAAVLVRVVNPDASIREGTTVEATTTAQADGSFTLQVPAELGDDLVITALDDAGNESLAVTATSGPEPDPFTGEDLADVEMFLFANQTGAITLPFTTGDERFVVVAQSLSPSTGPFE
ncbi:MAG TPA: hypothetical protein VJP59_11005, partial [Gemmatimonadota bacterium]|nr:hypothetical protein [Gemmatimonadota bacterium]